MGQNLSCLGKGKKDDNSRMNIFLNSDKDELDNNNALVQSESTLLIKSDSGALAEESCIEFSNSDTFNLNLNLEEAKPALNKAVQVNEGCSSSVFTNSLQRKQESQLSLFKLLPPPLAGVHRGEDNSLEQQFVRRLPNNLPYDWKYICYDAQVARGTMVAVPGVTVPVLNMPVTSPVYFLSLTSSGNFLYYQGNLVYLLSASGWIMSVSPYVFNVISLQEQAGVIYIVRYENEMIILSRLLPNFSRFVKMCKFRFLCDVPTVLLDDDFKQIIVLSKDDGYVYVYSYNGQYLHYFPLDNWPNKITKLVCGGDNTLLVHRPESSGTSRLAKFSIMSGKRLWCQELGSISDVVANRWGHIFCLMKDPLLMSHKYGPPKRAWSLTILNQFGNSGNIYSVICNIFITLAFQHMLPDRKSVV